MGERFFAEQTMRQRLAGVLLAGLTVTGCSESPTAPLRDSAEIAAALQVQSVSQQVAATTTATAEGWIGRLLDTLRPTDDPEALALLAQARTYREAARQAREAGRLEEARDYARRAFHAVLGAVIEIYPNSPARTGAAVDNALGRIEARLGTVEAPRVRRVLVHVRELRNAADRALARGDAVTALALNLRSMQILHRLVRHIRNRTDGAPDGVADDEMHGVNY